MILLAFVALVQDFGLVLTAERQCSIIFINRVAKAVYDDRRLPLLARSMRSGFENPRMNHVELFGRKNNQCDVAIYSNQVKCLQNSNTMSKAATSLE